MRKTMTLAVIALFSLGLTTASAHHGPVTTTINEAAKKQPGVPFPHEKHALKLVKSCETCHHTNKGLTLDNADKAKVQKCASCHLDPKGKVPSMRELSLTKNPFHIRCISCHKEQKKGPVSCKDCHVKK
jgi:Class III cytochrome C family